MVHKGSAREYVSGAGEWCMRVVHENSARDYVSGSRQFVIGARD